LLLFLIIKIKYQTSNEIFIFLIVEQIRKK